MFPSSHVVSKVSQRPAKRWGHQVRACEDHWLLGRGGGERGGGERGEEGGRWGEGRGGEGRGERRGGERGEEGGRWGRGEGGGERVWIRLCECVCMCV